MENQVRELLRDIAEDIPPQRQVPPTLRPRARRRIAATIGGAPRKVAKDGRWTPWVWSPTEDQLAVLHGRDVVLIDAETGRETDLGPTAGLTEFDGYAVRAMVWSPDGTRIAYSGGPGGG